MIAAADRLEELLAWRLEASDRFFDREAGRIAGLCRSLAERFLRGGRLLAAGGSPQHWSDAHHVAVEFVHPVIVGKRALPALAVDPAEVEVLAGPHDTVVSFDPVRFRSGADSVELDAGTDDPFVCQEIAETLYHVVWELVHVFLEHLSASTSGAGRASFLYPFLEGAAGSAGLEQVHEDVRGSVLMKAGEVSALRAQTIRENASEIVAAAFALRRAFDSAGTVYAFGNGGSATDAADLVADLRRSPAGWPPQRAVDLAGDGAVLTALANDIGPDSLFSRQVIAYGRPGDVAFAISTSGGSANVIEALAEARRRDMRTIALVGYDGGRIAGEGLADHVIVTRSDHIPRIQEAQATAYHAVLELASAAT